MNVVYLSDIPRAITALAEWCACLLCVVRRPRRFHGPKLWGIMAAGLAIQCAFLVLTDARHIFLWLPCMMAAVALMFGLIALCCDMPLTTVGYCTARAFLLAEFAASLEWQLYSYTLYTLGWQEAELKKGLLSLVMLAAVYALVFFGAYRLESRREDPRTAMIFQMRELWSPILIVLACFFLSNLSFVYTDTPFTSPILTEIYNIRTLVDVAGLAMLYAYHIQRCELFMQRELDSIQNVLQNQYTQYRQSRESIDVINRKYHDLKHQIAVLRAEPDADKRSAYLDGMEEEIRDYEAQNKTHRADLCGRRGEAGVYGRHGHLHHLRQPAGQRHRVRIGHSGQEKTADPSGRAHKKGFSGDPVRKLLPGPAGIPGRTARDHQKGQGVPRLRHQVHPHDRRQIRRHGDHPQPGRVV